jgi:hypothetical protein
MIIVFFSSLTYTHFAQIIDPNVVFTENPDSLKSNSSARMTEILLNSNPQDAYVFWNDSLIGNTPLFIKSRFQNLKLVKNGYDDLYLSFNDIIPGKIYSMNFNGENLEKSFIERNIFKILTAGIIVLGGTTAYFKLKADDKYEEYIFSGDPELLNDTRKYDLISGITFVALQITFGLLLYFFLTD